MSSKLEATELKLSREAHVSLASDPMLFHPSVTTSQALILHLEKLVLRKTQEFVKGHTAR